MIDLKAHLPYGLRQPRKDELLLEHLTALTAHHRAQCPPYARLLDALGPPPATRVTDIPLLPAALFKTDWLASVPADQVAKTLTSSGTTGQTSRIPLDRQTAALQAQALLLIMTDFLGVQPLPMVIVDRPSTLADPHRFDARAAAIRGMLAFGRQPFFALDEDMRLDAGGLKAFLAGLAGQRVLVFGLTWIVWKHFVHQVAEAGLRFADAVLVHSGGWKQHEAEAVDNADFKARMLRMAGIGAVRNVYDMAEQVGSVFVEGADGLLYPPWFADAIIRDPLTLAPVPDGQPGVIQVVSLLPRSYPGHSILTEDLGVIEHVDWSAPGRCGKGLRILGRVPDGADARLAP